MTIAEKITRAKSDIEDVFWAGRNEGYEKAGIDIEALNTELEEIVCGKDSGGKGFYDTFWDEYQQNGKRTDYEGVFAGGGWNAKTLKPKYSLDNVTMAQQMFWANKNELDLTEVLNNAGVVLNTSQAFNISNMFAHCNFTRICAIDMTKAPTDSYSVFANAKKLKTIDKIIIPDKAFTFNSWFANCIALENLTVEGVIKSSGFNVQWSTKLTKASITSIINALSTSTTGLTITLSKTAVNNAFTTDEWNKLIATKTNWTISLA